MSQGGHFVQHTPQGPEVWLVVVWLVLTDLRAKVVRCPNTGLGIVYRPFKDSGNSKVAKFDIESFGDEDILRLDISVKNMATMDIFESQADLEKYE